MYKDVPHIGLCTINYQRSQIHSFSFTICIKCVQVFISYDQPLLSVNRPNWCIKKKILHKFRSCNMYCISIGFIELQNYVRIINFKMSGVKMSNVLHIYTLELTNRYTYQFLPTVTLA
jgi:hypothetical protein